MGHRPIPKAIDRRQRRNKGALALHAIGDMPAPPDRLLKETRDQWEAYWNSDLAHAVKDPQRNGVGRLFKLYDERERSYRQVRQKGRLVKGSQGQLVASPLLRYIAQCDAEIRQIEDRLGLNPRAWAQLGTAFASAQKNLDDLNTSLEHDDSEDDGNDADPRLVKVVS